MNFNLDNMKTISGRESNHKSNDVKARPSNDLKPRKDFKKILQKNVEDEDEDENGAMKEIMEESSGFFVGREDEIKKKSPPSLFDLTSRKAVTTLNEDKISHKAKTESSSEIYTTLMSISIKKNTKETLFDLSSIHTQKNSKQTSFGLPSLDTKNSKQPPIDLAAVDPQTIKEVLVELATVDTKNSKQPIDLSVVDLQTIKETLVDLPSLNSKKFKQTPIDLFAVDPQTIKESLVDLPSLETSPINKTPLNLSKINTKKTVKEPSADLSSINEKNTKERSFDTPTVSSQSEKNKSKTRFSSEQTELASLNPLAALTNQSPITNLIISTEKAVVPVKNIQEIINQMVEKITEMKHTGTTDTVITLKNESMFQGATIIITAFDSAKNEFNISIENLTQAGKQLMDKQGNKESLLLALEQKGYAVHILTTTTLVENRLMDTLPQEDQSGRQRGDEKEDERQRRGQSQS